MQDPTANAEVSADALVWVLSEDKAGMRNQAVGLAEAIGRPFAVKTIAPTGLQVPLPAGLWLAPLAALPPPQRAALAPPWPALLISSGRRAVPYALWLRRQAGDRMLTVHINRPQVAPNRFDLVVTPAFDRLAGDNVLATTGALHRVTPALLSDAQNRFSGRFAALPRPHITVLIGGANRYYRMNPDWVTALAQSLRAIQEVMQGSLLLSTSRRTGEENIAALQAVLTGPYVECFTHTGENPYFGYLSTADHIVVTADSISMMTESLATGRPVHVVHPPRTPIAFPPTFSTNKFDLFHRQLLDDGYTRQFTMPHPAEASALETWNYPPLLETGRVADMIRRRLGWLTG